VTQAQAPNNLLTVIEAYPVGTIKFCFDGKIGWHTDGKKVTYLKGVDLAVTQREAVTSRRSGSKTTSRIVTLPA
jgi:hypothetical protein